jgi:hypothetical protein
MRKLKYLKSLFSPFKPLRLSFYCGKTKIGTPYFLPRKWIKHPEKPGYTMAIPRKVGFDFVGLGWKTKWSDTDYRFEWSPRISFVFFGYQIAIIVIPDYQDHYWEAWLYYENDTDKTKSKKYRVAQCRKEFPRKFTTHYPDKAIITIDYYDRILKSKYLK